MAAIFLKYWDKYLIDGVSYTLLLSAITVLGGVVFASLLALMKMSKVAPLRWLSTIYIEVIRGTPMLLQLYFFYFGLPMLIPTLNKQKFLCIAIALICNSAAYVSEVIRSGIQAVDPGQREAALSLNRGTLGNKPASGTAILDELGEEHIKTGKLIVYTSADSVFQIAANEAIVPLEELYRDCQIARELLTGELEVGRVIARPFVGDHAGAFKRTGARRDFSAQPPTTMCDILAENGKTVYGVGKIEDIFDHRGITKSNHAAGNPACMQATFEAMDEDFDGLLFVNLVDFDMVYGHRRDVKGYAAALEAFDAQLPQIQAKMGEDDLLIITADHGCDPCHSGTDHTREHTPLLVWSKKMQGGANLGVRATYADISATVLDYFGLANPLHGVSFLKELK